MRLVSVKHSSGDLHRLGCGAPPMTVGEVYPFISLPNRIRFRRHWPLTHEGIAEIFGSRRIEWNNISGLRWSPVAILELIRLSQSPLISENGYSAKVIVQIPTVAMAALAE